MRGDSMVIVLNGGSSSGKSSLARSLQELLPDPWLAFSVDTLVDAMPSSCITFTPDGEVHLGPRFGELEDAWMAGVATMVRSGARVILDDVFLSGPASQERWRVPLTGLDVLWVGVRCDPEVAARREHERGDRPTGMARSQATMVHEGVVYDMEVDTSFMSADDCAQLIAKWMNRQTGETAHEPH
ncbi:AAA family ATPase [Nonomuraea dietziae]|uniref:chloramphenicol phosphotransferase CPT family protein n=1 Tax=Nonomuraea dietziae TaxID=65515 RepID=UPI003403C807